MRCLGGHCLRLWIRSHIQIYPIFWKITLSIKYLRWKNKAGMEMLKSLSLQKLAASRLNLIEEPPLTFWYFPVTASSTCSGLCITGLYCLTIWSQHPWDWNKMIPSNNLPRGHSADQKKFIRDMFHFNIPKVKVLK